MVFLVSFAITLELKMSKASEHTKGDLVPDTWEVIVIVIILMVIYGYVSSELSYRRKRKIREESIPPINDGLRSSVNYNIHLSDGRKFQNVQIIGSIEESDAEYSFAGWDGMLVLINKEKKKIYLKKLSIRFIEEL